MNSATLHPPNSQLFSESVIGSVMQRAWIRDDFTDVNAVDSFDFNDDFESHASSEYTEVRDSLKARDIVQERHPHLTATRREKKRTGDVSRSRAVEYQRQLRRMRQIRYRKRKYELTMKLEKDTVRLRKEVEELEQCRRSIAVTVPTNKSVWDIALQFFQVFRFGVQEPLRQHPTESTSTQLNFLLSTMTEDVVFNSRNGVEAIMQTFKCQTFWFKDLRLELEGLVKSPTAALVATTTTSFIITERTLQKGFPHLSGKHGSRGKNRVAETLLGQRIIARGSARFEWDAALGRVSRITTQSDLLTPMLRLLNSLEDASVVFEKALISPDFQLSPKI